jgi:hypothetical protein
MQTFVQLVVTGKIDSKKDTKHINDVLTQLQANGAVIKNVSLSAASSGSALQTRGDFALYVITYEADASIDLK